MSRADVFLVVAAAVAGAAVAAFACGDRFRSWGLASATDDAVLATPHADFRDEIARVFAPSALREVTGDSRAAEEADLREALAARGLDASAIDETVGRVATFRAALDAHVDALWQWRCALRTEGLEPPSLRGVVPPANLPLEFSLHLEGCALRAEGNHDAARAAWSRVLALPESERPYRSTWAAYMLGRSHVERDAARAAENFALCRDLAARGFRDTDRLAVASLGWEARARFLADDPAGAILLYLQQMREGADTAASLRTVARVAAQKGPDVLARLASEPGARRVMTAFAVEESAKDWTAAPGFARRWLDAVESAGAPADDADRLAWIAYGASEFALADRWAGRAPEDSPVAAWIASKLRVREGRLDEAAALLVRAERGFGDGDAGPVRGERGIVELCRGRYAESLDLLLAASYFEDAAYVAERVLTPGELRDYVDRRFGDDADEPAPADEFADVAWDPKRLRGVLGRRLVRLGRFDEARAYLPAGVRPRLDAYVAALREASDPELSAAARSAAFRKAASLAIDHGDRFLGAENEPDWCGWVRDGERFRNRRPEVREDLDALRPRADEKSRYAASAPGSSLASLVAARAWSAAELMPDEQEATAAWLAGTATWLAKREPESAKRFEDALLRRCGTTLTVREFAKHAETEAAPEER